jgi:hypothetical protein
MDIQTEQYKGHMITIELDNDPLDPRTEFDNLTEFHIKQSRYYLGEHQHRSASDIDDVVREAKERGDMVLRLYAYIHSGTFLSLESFYGRLPQGHAEFDSGCCGVIIVRREKMLREFGRKRWRAALRRRAYEIAQSDVEVFTAYLNGAVYGYVVDDHVESCWGFYDTEEAMREAKEVVDHMVATSASPVGNR